ncbi:hypothetical protein D9M70_609420 [compost metagenome]
MTVSEKKVTAARNEPSAGITSMSDTVVLAVEVDGKRSSSGSEPIRWRSSEVLPAPVVPTNSVLA